MDIEDEQHAKIIRGLSEKDFRTLLLSPSESMYFGLPRKREWDGHNSLASAFNDRVVSLAESSGNLSCAIFQLHVNFQYAKFSKPIIFGNAKFLQSVSFDDAKFLNFANFSNTIFSAGVSFRGAKFFDLADFSGAKFSSVLSLDIRFDRVKFFDVCDFRDASFMGNVYFHRTAFESSVLFDNCSTTYNGTIRPTQFDFFEAKFKYIPWFQNVKISQNSSIHRAIFPKKLSIDDEIDEEEYAKPYSKPRMSYPQAGCERGIRFEENVSTSQRQRRINEHKEKYWGIQEDAARALKLTMGEIRHKSAEGVFHALELDARRQRPSTPWHQRCLLGIYNHVSQCGQSIFRPLAFLCFFFLAFMLWFKSAFAMCSSGNDALSSLDKGFKFAFQSIVPFYAQIKGKSASLLMIPDETLGCYLSFHIVSLLESLIAAGCLAMSIIALRWHLRRG